MYTYRISIKSNFADIDGTFSQEEPLTFADFSLLTSDFMPSGDEIDESAFEATDKGDWFHIYRKVRTRSGGVATAECELID